jgi:hypothetical protein
MALNDGYELMIVRLYLRTGYQVPPIYHHLYLHSIRTDHGIFPDIPDVEMNPYESASQAPVTGYGLEYGYRLCPQPLNILDRRSGKPWKWSISSRGGRIRPYILFSLQVYDTR